MALRFKKSVEVWSIKFPAAYAIGVASHLATTLNLFFTVTSVEDGRHGSAASLHYRGLAFDVRTRDWSRQDTDIFKQELTRHLGTAYDVVDEGDHIHVEYDPPTEKHRLIEWTD